MSTQAKTATTEEPTDFTLEQAAIMVERALRDYLHQMDLVPDVQDAVEHVLLGSGKRVRPIIALQSCWMVGGDPVHALPAAVALEMIHSVSLIQDDLPAMDDSPLRRGQPTLHRRCGEAVAILASDALFNGAFDVLAQRVDDSTKAQELILELCSANFSLVNGQTLDVQYRVGSDTDAAGQLLSIHQQKTASLIRASARMGARCGEATSRSIACLTRFAETLGLLFQIVDDVLDVTSTEETLGKPVRQDCDKLTHPAVFGLHASLGEIKNLHRQALAALSSFGDKAEPLRSLCRTVTDKTAQISVAAVPELSASI